MGSLYLWRIIGILSNIMNVLCKLLLYLIFVLIFICDIRIWGLGKIGYMRKW